MKPIFLALSMILFTPSVFATGECEDAVSRDENPTRLAHEAALLFQEGEQEIKVSLMLGQGAYKRVIDARLGAKLRRAISKLESVPGDHLEALEVFRELADILEGVKAVNKYSRKEIVGYVPVEPPPKEELRTAQENAELTWRNFENTPSYTFLGKGVFIRTKVNNKLHDRRLVPKLIKNVIGDGIFEVNRRRDLDKIFVVNFTLYAHDPERLAVYKLSGYRTTLKDYQENRSFIQAVEKVSFEDEVEYYKQMAIKYEVKDVKFRLAHPINGRFRVVIHGRNVYKIEHKHRIPIADLVSNLRKAQFSDIKEYGIRNEFFQANTVVNGKTLRMIFRKDFYQFERMILKTTFVWDSELEPAMQILEKEGDN